MEADILSEGEFYSVYWVSLATDESSANCSREYYYKPPPPFYCQEGETAFDVITQGGLTLAQCGRGEVCMR